MIPLDDSFISDNEDDCCPLCVEEMDISDKNFKPCPCGYQICQFCYNNIRLNPQLNGRCPACRRLYDDESAEYKSILAEEYKVQQLKKDKRDRDRKQREKEKKETEMANKKHLAGLRVVQKNLVYVTGLNPPCTPEDLHSILRSDKYFGRYGKISKIVINKKNPGIPANTLQPTQHILHGHSNHGLVVYVTFSRKEDALRCIVELDGTVCDGRTLRAAHGTTKYCSSYLRGHPCPNPNCMFLHEPGEEADSYTRKDLSTQQGIKMGMMESSGVTSRLNGSAASNLQMGEKTHAIASQPHVFGFSGHDEDASFQQLTDEDEHHERHKQHPGPILPVTAHWAQGALISTVNSPLVDSTTLLAISAAFPTLGEITREQKQVAKKDVKLKSKATKPKDIGGISPDEVDLDDSCTESYIERVMESLHSLSVQGKSIPVTFKPSGKQTASTFSLFAFHPKELPNDTKLDEEKILARQVIERFMLKPLKNYHLSYQNHPLAQQQSILQAQLQQQQSQQLYMSQTGSQHQQFRAPESNQFVQCQTGPVLLPSNAPPQIPHILQPSQPFLVNNSQVVNPRYSERLSVPGAPPPPGLFANPSTSQQISSELYNADGTSLAVGPPLAAPSSSSQLLTQLMSGKK